MMDAATLWFLRRFKLFRETEQKLDSALTRLDMLGASAARKAQLDKGSRGRVEAEVYHAALIHVPCHFVVDLLPTKQSEEHSRGVVAVQIIEGSRP